MVVTQIPATTIDTYVQRTLNYMVLRHPDEKVARQMADAARSVIGNESQFDLNFRTERLTPLKGKPLKGKKIHTYCAGLLLLCGQQTAEPRRAFFPIPEYPAGGLAVKNLAKLGLTFGDKFISPTGALFSEVEACEAAELSPAVEVAHRSDLGDQSSEVELGDDSANWGWQRGIIAFSDLVVEVLLPQGR